MVYFQRSIRFIIFSLASMVAMVTVAQPVSILKWGEAGGDSTIITDGNAAQNKPGPIYSTSTPLNPADGVKGYDLSAAGQTRTFYGASSTLQSANVVNNNDSTGDHIQLVFKAEGTLKNMIAWDQSGFLNNTHRVLDTISMEFASRGGDYTRAHFLIKTSVGWYQSQQVHEATGTSYTAISLGFASLGWTPWAQFGNSAGTAPNADITDIQSIGAFFESSASSDTWTGAKVRYFEATATTAVPEPGSYALIVGLLLFGYVIQRRR